MAALFIQRALCRQTLPTRTQTLKRSREGKPAGSPRGTTQNCGNRQKLRDPEGDLHQSPFRMASRGMTAHSKPEPLEPNLPAHTARCTRCCRNKGAHRIRWVSSLVSRPKSASREEGQGWLGSVVGEGGPLPTIVPRLSVERSGSNGVGFWGVIRGPIDRKSKVSKPPYPPPPPKVQLRTSLRTSARTYR